MAAEAFLLKLFVPCTNTEIMGCSTCELCSCLRKKEGWHQRSLLFFPCQGWLLKRTFKEHRVIRSKLDWWIVVDMENFTLLMSLLSLLWCYTSTFFSWAAQGCFSSSINTWRRKTQKKRAVKKEISFCNSSSPPSRRVWCSLVAECASSTQSDELLMLCRLPLSSGWAEAASVGRV